MWFKHKHAVQPVCMPKTYHLWVVFDVSLKRTIHSLRKVCFQRHSSVTGPFSLLAIVRPMPLSLTLFLLSLSSFSNSLDVIQSFCSSSLVISALVSSPSLSSVLKGSTASVFHLSLASLSESFLTKMDCKSQLYRK